MTMLSSKSAKSSTTPKRPVQKKQNKLGPYNLLQTLGEGEFGKVKLGIHSETGQEVHFNFICIRTSTNINNKKKKNYNNNKKKGGY